MHIAIFHNILWSKYKGGVFSAMHELVAGSGAQITFTQIAETDAQRVSLGGVDLSYHRYPYELLFPGAYHATPTSLRVLALAARTLKTQADVVVLPGYERIEYWVMLAILVARRKPRAVFCDSTAHDNPPSKVKFIAKRLFFSLCDGFFAYGSRSRDYLMMHGVRSEDVYFRCQAAALPHDYREEDALKNRLANAPKVGEAPRFLYVGRLSREKGLDTLIQSMALVLQQRPDAKLFLVGGGPDKDSLIHEIERLGLSQAIQLLGSMDIAALTQQYAQATALVLPSTSEPWGLVVNEALSLGCPAIVSNVCGCVPELVLDGVTGFSFKVNDVQALADRMLRAPKAFGEVASVASTCIRHMRKFTPENAAKQILSGCEQILNKTGKQR